MRKEELEKLFFDKFNEKIVVSSIEKNKVYFIYDNLNYSQRINRLLISKPNIRSVSNVIEYLEYYFKKIFKENIKILNYVNHNEHSIFIYNGLKYKKKPNSILKQLPTIKSCLEKDKYFQNLSNKKHGLNRYSYFNLDTNYNGIHKKIQIRCNVCNNIFHQTIGHHFYSGEGCPICNKYTKHNTMDEIDNKFLYIIRLFNDNENFIKIGITINNSNNRFSSFPYKKEILFFKKIKNTYIIEQELQNKYKKFKYEPKISFGGYTECFKLDILKSNLLSEKKLFI